MSRKAPTFRQLSFYIGQNEYVQSGQAFCRNLYYDGNDEATVSRIFLQNYQHLPKRKNGNALYHEVLVITPQPHLSRAQQRAILHALSDRYCKLRAPKQLVWGKAHFDTDYPHIHLMISANAYRSDRRCRLTKQAFSDIQKEMEAFKEKAFPQLSDQNVYRNPSPTTVKHTQDEGEMIRRNGKLSKKDRITHLVRQYLRQSSSIEACCLALKAHQLEFYQRGKNWGVINISSGKRYRLKTLGMSDAFKTLEKGQAKISPNPRMEAFLKRKQQLSEHAERQLSDCERDDIDRGER